MNLRVIHIIATMNPSAGGTSTIVKELAAALRENGCSVTVACVDEPNEAWHTLANISVVCLGWPLWRHRYSLSLRLLHWIRELRGQYDVAVLHGIWQFHLLVASIVLPRAKIPYVVYAHGMLTEGSMHWGRLKYFKKKLYWWLIERHTLRRAAAVVFTTPHEMKHSIAQVRGDGIRGVVIHNGIEGIRASSESRERLMTTPPYILALGRIHPIKGLDIAIGAIASLGDDSIRLVVAGDGAPNYVTELRQLAARLDIADRVEFVGLVAGERKNALICGADVLLAPSHHENFGIAIVEALSAGIPALTTKEVGVWQEIEKYAAGILFDPNIESCASAIRRWGRLSEGEKLAYRQRARLCFESNFDIKRTAAELRDLLVDAVKRLDNQELGQ